MIVDVRISSTTVAYCQLDSTQNFGNILHAINGILTYRGRDKMAAISQTTFSGVIYYTYLYLFHAAIDNTRNATKI